MGLLHIQADKYMMVNGLQLGIQYFVHMYQGKDLDIYFSYMLYWIDSRN